MVWTEAAIFA